MRSIMGKFGLPDKARKQQPYYTGHETLVASVEELKLHKHIVDGDMPKTEATRVLKGMNPNTAMASREEFVRLVAALVLVYPQKLDVKRGEKTTLRSTLVATCQPQRIEWYLNNIRFRSRLTTNENKFLDTGTCRNEQIHATLNAHYKQTVRISKRMLNAQLKAWLGAEMTVFLRAMQSNNTVGMRRADLRQTVLSGVNLFTTSTWTGHVASAPTSWTSSPNQPKSSRKRRCGGTPEQAAVYKAIRNKMAPMKRASVYGSHAQKRLRAK